MSKWVILLYHCSALLVSVTLVWLFLTVMVEGPRRQRVHESKKARTNPPPTFARLKRDDQKYEEERDRRAGEILDRVRDETKRWREELDKLRARLYTNVARVDSIDQQLSTHVSVAIERRKVAEEQVKEKRLRFFTEYEQHLRALQRTNLLLSTAKTVLDRTTQILRSKQRGTRTKRWASCDYIESLKTNLPALPGVNYC